MNRFFQWAKEPFTDDMDILSVTLTTVLVVTIAFLWTRILRQVID